MSTDPIVILGAGPAGMSAAWRLSELGQPVIVAQTAPPTHPGQGASSVGVPKSPHPHQEPCWQVAGIPKSAMEQRRAITRATTSQVESVCADSSLTQQQKRDKIRQIHEVLGIDSLTAS